MSSDRGCLIALEGIDGCGKSTQARILAGQLGALLTHEPGATPLGQALRALLLDPDRPAPAARAEALLMAADRAQHVDEVVRPALLAGRWVVTDRFSGSTLAYQGWGRGLAVEPLRRVVAWAAGDVAPDLSVLVDVDPAVARRRLGGGRADRLEAMGPGFHERVREGFAALAAEDPDRWAVVDGGGSEASVAAAVAAAVAARLGSPQGAGG
ncbi:MAG: dTMP kinase [Acidimicrobiales bacterium]